jgi:hypothetical protein
MSYGPLNGVGEYRIAQLEDYFALARRELAHRTRMRSSQEVLSPIFGNDERMSPYKRRCRKERFSVDPMGQYSNADSETI